MKIAVVGSGYVGLVLGACLAENGNDVTCIDKDAAKVRQPSPRASCPSTSPASRRWSGATARRSGSSSRPTCRAPVRAASIVFIAVGTPQHEDGSADLTHVLGVAREIAKAMNGYKVIVDKSTVPVGTAARVRELIAPRDLASLQRRQQSGIPEAGRRGRGLPEARSRRHRRRRRSGAGADGRALRAVHAHGRADHGDGLRQRRAVQVRRERDSRHAHLVHERDRERLRGVRRRRRSGAQGHRRRSPHRAVVPVSRHRVRRQLLSEGHQGAHQVLRRQGLRFPDR